MRPDSGQQRRLLIVDDEPAIASLLSAGVRFVGFDVRTAASGAEALAVAADFDPELLVLDVMLPDCDGFEVVRQLRAGGARVPVLFLTARDGLQDKITGLDVGGDDYVTKPFSLEEVIARIHAVLRRTYATGGAEDEATLRFAGLELDVDTRDVRRGGKLVRLSPTEFKLLHYLMANAGRVVSKAQILDHVWRYDFGGDGRIVEAYISILRRKVDTVDPPLIHTLRGRGYSLRTPRS